MCGASGELIKCGCANDVHEEQDYFMVGGVTLVLTFMHIIKRLVELNALVTSVLLIRVCLAKAVN